MADLQSIADRAVAEGMVGCAIGVRRGDGYEAVAAGLADRDAGTPVTINSQFRIASVTKSFVSAVILQLSEAGRLDLEAKIERWLPGKAVADVVSVYQVLNQTGGLPVYSLYRLEDYPPADAALYKSVYIDDAWKATPPTGPGGPWHYANVGSRVLGVIAEAVTGRELPDLITSRLLEPLGLVDTMPSGWSGPPPARFTKGYDHTQGTPRDVTTRVPPLYLWSGGDMISTVADLSLWMRALVAGDVLGPAMRARLRDELVPGAYPGSTMSHHGPGLMVFSQDRARLFGYRGSTPGFVGIVGHDPEADISIAVQTNSYAEDSSSVYRAHVEALAFDVHRLVTAGGPV